MEEEKAYEIVLDGLNYRIKLLHESLENKYLPKELRDEYQDKLKRLKRLHDDLFNS